MTGAVTYPLTILQQICRHICGEESKNTLLNLAVSWKDTSNAALDIIWEQMDSLIPLIDILRKSPEGSVALADQSSQLIFVSHPDRRTWDRFISYAHRIKSFAFTADLTRNLPCMTLFRLAELNGPRPLFPNLKKLHVVATDTGALSSLFLFLSPSLQVIEVESVETRDTALIQSFMSTLAENGSAIERISVKGTSTHSILWCMSRFTNLRSLELGVVECHIGWFEAILRLEHLGHLRVMEVTGPTLSELDRYIMDTVTIRDSLDGQNTELNSEAAASPSIAILGPSETPFLRHSCATKRLDIGGCPTVLAGLLPLTARTPIEEIILRPVASVPWASLMSVTGRRNSNLRKLRRMIELDKVYGSSWHSISPPWVQEIGRFWDSLGGLQTSSGLPLKRLSLGQWTPDSALSRFVQDPDAENPPELGLDLLAKLSRLSSLQSLDLGSWTIVLLESFFTDVLAGMTELRELVLSLSPFQRGIKLSSLDLLASSCPHLEYLEMPIEIAEGEEVPTTPRAFSDTLRKISTNEWEVESKFNNSTNFAVGRRNLHLAIAGYMSALFPRLQEISAEGEWRYVQEILKVLSSARRHERRRISGIVGHNFQYN